MQQRSEIWCVYRFCQRIPSGPELHRGVDPNKDQSYFLWTLTREQLAYTLLPVGDTIKDSIRSEAAAAKIPTALKKDSQGICFLGHVDIKDFLSHYTTLVPGSVKDENGTVVGTHNGALLYTPGQRHGLTITTKTFHRVPYYVTGKDIEQNLVFVSTQKPVTSNNDTIHLETITLRSSLVSGKTLLAQTRYRQTPFRATVEHLTDTSLTLTPEQPTELPAAGQSCVLYDDSHCIGGGMIV